MHNSPSESFLDLSSEAPWIALLYEPVVVVRPAPNADMSGFILARPASDLELLLAEQHVIDGPVESSDGKRWSMGNLARAGRDATG